MSVCQALIHIINSFLIKCCPPMEHVIHISNLSLCMLFHYFLFIFKIKFFVISFRNTIRVSNSLDPDQASHFVGPDLDPSCLQG